MHYDEEVGVFINGKQVTATDGRTQQYEIVAIAQEHCSVLRKGDNVLAVHCRQSTSGQFIDVHFVDSNDPPDLPRAKPFLSKLITPWGEKVSAENAWAEYPRPQLDREQRHCLSGNWQSAVSSIDQTDPPSAWDGEIAFQLGPLGQGSWPDGLLTSPVIRGDAVWHRVAQVSHSFNMIHKHFKVAPRRYDYHCDRFGMMVWQDQVIADHNPPWTRLSPNPEDAGGSDKHYQQVMLELERMIDNLENHPSFVVWVPFNLAWGQHRTVEVGQWMAQRDLTRLINISGGGYSWPAGDIVDLHNLPHHEFQFDEARYRNFIKVVGEFGGYGYLVERQLWDAERDIWGYGGLPLTDVVGRRDGYVQPNRRLMR